MSRGPVLWRPPPDAVERTRLGRFLTGAAERTGRSFAPAAEAPALGSAAHGLDYEAAWRWSVDDLDGFWALVWDHLDVRAHTPPTATLADRAMPGTRWFPGATLNDAEHLLRHRGDGVALWSVSQTRPTVSLTRDELVAEVARVRSGLVELGVGRGDRVVGYLPNVAEAVVAFLATASLGAVWSSCPPEFGVRSVVDRFGQIDPVVLVAVDGYRYGDKVVDRTADLARIRAALPGLRATVHVPYLGDGPPPGAVPWTSLGAGAAPTDLAFEPVPFDHPLYVLYSSGTTGLPKPIVHGHGGILLEHHKALALHCDVGPGDRVCWFSTTGWMMWNFLVSALAEGAGVVLFDGDPGHPDLLTLWRLAAELEVTHLGTSAPFLLANRKQGAVPGRECDLGSVRMLGSTGAPLPAEGYVWVYDAVGTGLLLSSISGGTDVCTAFVGGNPLLPVRAGEMASRWLGCDVRAVDRSGRARVGEQGELVVAAPMPSMPVGLWGDGDGTRLRSAYFSRHPGVWTHGDWITIEPDGACTISGRSDATLNRGGVRVGTADVYRVVEDLPEVVDSLVVHLDDPAAGLDRLELFVVLAAGLALDDDLRARIVAAVRRDLSPRHVPDAVTAVPAVPRTLSGKKLEVPVKRILTGASVDEVASDGALADPTALAPFVALADRRTGDPAPRH